VNAFLEQLFNMSTAFQCRQELWTPVFNDMIDEDLAQLIQAGSLGQSNLLEPMLLISLVNVLADFTRR